MSSEEIEAMALEACLWQIKACIKTMEHHCLVKPDPWHSPLIQMQIGMCSNTLRYVELVKKYGIRRKEAHGK